MEKPQVEQTVHEIVSRLIEPRLSLLDGEFSRAGEAILKELASIRTRVAELLRKELGEEIFREVSSVIAEELRRQEEKAGRQLAETVAANDAAWEGRLSSAVAQAEDSCRAAAIEEAAIHESRWEERLEDTRSRIEAEWQLKLDDALDRRDAEWQSRLAAAESEYRQAAERQLAEALSAAEKSWRLNADRREASQQERWRQQIAEATARAGDPWRDRLTAVVTLGREVLSSTNQTEIMALMVDTASLFAGRVVLFIAKDDFLVAWKTAGNAWEPAPPAAGGIRISSAAATAVSAARAGLSTCSGEPGDHAENGTLLDILGGEHPERILAVPVVVAGKVPGVLYADHRPADPIPMNEEAILHLVSLVQHRIEMIGLQRQGRAAESATAERAAAPPAPAPPAAAPPRPRPAPAQPAPPTTAASPSTPEPGAGLANLGLDDLLTSDTAPPLSAPAPPPAQPKARRAGAKTPAASDDPVASAQRLARILVSEIKLYNEKALAEARANGNIYRGLKREIDVSRRHYASKVSKEVASRGDYFHEEIVRTLCQGDPSLLGKDYPGPVSL